MLDIKPDSPADRASLKLNDIIVDVDDQAVRSPAEMARLLKKHRRGDTVLLGFLRAGTRRRVTVTLNGTDAGNS